jgi:hypothetical protein
MEIRKDVLGQIPDIGDIVGFNPAKYKGLVYGKCIGYTKSGLPKIANIDFSKSWVSNKFEHYDFLVPKTGFLVCKNINNGDTSKEMQ